MATVVATALVACTLAVAALRYGQTRFDLQAIAVAVLAASLGAAVTVTEGLPASTPVTLNAVAAAAAVAFVARFPGRGRPPIAAWIVGCLVLVAVWVGAAIHQAYTGWITVGVMGAAAALTVLFAALRFRLTSHPRGASLQLVATATLGAGLASSAVLPAGTMLGWTATGTRWVAVVLTGVGAIACAAALAYALVRPMAALRDHIAWVAVPGGLVGAVAWWLAPPTGPLVTVVGTVAMATVFGVVRQEVVDSGTPRSRKKGVPRRTRETLIALERLTDPLAVQERVVEALTHLLAGAQLELWRSAAAPDGVLEKARAAPMVLVQAAARHGALLDHQIDELTTQERAAFVEVGAGLVVPVQAGPVLYGLLAVSAERIDRAGIAQARRFADLLGLKLETHRLYSELETQKRLASLGTLTAALAHDLRNPLSAIRLNLQMLGRHRDVLGSDAECIDLALDEVDRLNAELQTLLDFSRPITLDADTFAPETLAAEAAHQVAGRFAEREVTLQTNVAPDLPRLRGDLPRLARVLANLLDNASAASSTGGNVVLRVRAGEGAVRLSVVDRGTGIAQEDLPRLFDPFFTRRPDGTGLGLAIARKIVKAHRGRLTVTSTLGRGSTFAVELPVV